MPDCPHIHIQDSGLQDFRDIIRRETEGGLTIVRFLNRAMEGDLPDYKPHHELKAAEILTKYGYEEAAERVRQHKASKPRRPSSNGSRSETGGPDLNKAEGRDPGLNEFVQFIRDETDNGRTIVRNLIHAMETHEDPYKPHHNLEAAKQLIENGFPLTDALICHPDCSHHAVGEPDTPSDTTDDTDSTEKETVPDPKWIATVAEIKRMEDEGEIPAVEYDPFNPPIDISFYLPPEDFDLTPYLEEADAFRARLDLQAERRANWPEVEEYRRKKLAQMYPSHSDGDPPET